jgi:hypothetical protein
MKPNTCDLGVYPIAKLPKGEFIRFKVDGPVYIRGDYDRSTRTFELTAFNDVNRCIYRPGSTPVLAGFTF